MAAAILLFVTRMPHVAAKPTIADIADIVMVADATVKSTAQMLLPFMMDIMPANWGPQEAIAGVEDAIMM